ncbi:PHD finger protein 11-like isoform X8 [Apodemus sylvaticus]|uniref:PHD finger protein 11-like isoform X8 n=2 Tax=Apodemus sylvaticus TaxID=10129 RepID=UPI002242F944|nr:PHD finger protein 11-like isoform X8 [Apodemus sylvaticus]
MAQETAQPCGPVSTGDCPVIEKMEKRTCALCPEGHEWSQIYFAPSANIAAHENCLLYSSGLVECEVHDTPNTTRNFDVKSVKKEIWRGRRLKCSLCNEGGATVGCDLSHCKKSYHYVCAKKDQAIPQVDGDHGIYKVFCPEHAPQQEETTESADSPSMKKKRGRKKRLSPGPPTEPKKMKFSSSKRHMMEEPDDRTAAKASFLKKCQEAGLLTELFEQILEKVDSIHRRFMDETASESDYEGIETLLFDCGLFGDTLRKFQEVIKSKVCESEGRQRQMKQQLEALADLQQSLSSFQDNGDLDHSSSASGSSLSPEDHQVRYQGSPEVQAGSGVSL